MSRRAEIRRRNREALLTAAAEVFSDRGFRVATIDEVAEAAGLTKGAVYSHFASKHDLFAAAIERRYAERVEAFRALTEGEGSIEERAARAAVDFTRSVTADADWALLFLEAWAEMLRNPAFAERLRAVHDEIRAVLAEVIAQQLAVAAPRRVPDAERIAEMVLAMSHGFGIAHRLDPAHAPEALFADMTATFAAGLAAGG